MKHIYGVERDEVFWAASDVGWVVGHSYIVYGPLFNGSTTILFEGKPIYPDAGVFWRVIKDHNVNVRTILQEFIHRLSSQLQPL
jgi:propionyl-CoA synthetase